MLRWFISDWPAVLGVLFGALGVILLWWSRKPITDSPRAKAMDRSRVVRRLDALFNRDWQAAIPVAFAVATGLIGLGLGSAVDRFGPEPGQRPTTAGYYEELLWIGGGAAVLALGLGAAFWRGRVNREEGLGTAIVIDERLVDFDRNEHGAFAHKVRTVFHTTVDVPHVDDREPVWRLAGQDWGARAEQLTWILRIVMQLDRPDTPTSLFIKAPWSVAMAVGNLLHRAGSEGTSLRVRAFPHDGDLPGLPRAKAIEQAVQPAGYFTFSQEPPARVPVASANWLSVPTSGDRDAEEPCLVVAIRVPTNPLGVMHAKASGTDTQLSGPFTLLDQGQEWQATHILEVEVAGAGTKEVLAHADIPGIGHVVYKALCAALQEKAAELNLSKLSDEGRIYLATTVVGELAPTLGWLFNNRAPGTQLRFKPLVYSEEKESLLAAPGLTISLKLPQAESASPTT